MHTDDHYHPDENYTCDDHLPDVYNMASEGDNDGLFSSTVDISKWQTALLCYEEVVELKAAGKSKKASKKEETLQELDEW